MKIHLFTIIAILCYSCHSENDTIQNENEIQENKVYAEDSSSYSVGLFTNNIKTGWWKSYNANGGLLSEDFYNNNEQLLHEVVTDGKVSSAERIITPSGELIISYHSNGRMKFFGYFTQADSTAPKVLSGDAREYDSTGVMRLYSNFDNEKGLVSEREYNSSGQLFEERYYSLACPTCDKKPTGTWKTYSKGKLEKTTKH
jgi:antitoxin component YwqK of YwqJK toxin-antitoxin module